MMKGGIRMGNIPGQLKDNKIFSFQKTPRSIEQAWWAEHHDIQRRRWSQNCINAHVW